MSTSKNNSNPASSQLTKDWPHWLSITLFSIIGFGLWVFNQAYLTPLLLGFILAALSYPIYEFVLSKIKFKHLKEGLAASFTMIILTLSFTILINFLARELVKEVPKFGNSLTNFVNDIPNNETIVKFGQNFGLEKSDLEYLSQRIKADTSSSSNLLGANDAGKNFSEVFSQDNINTALDVSKQAFTYIFTQLVYFVIFLLAWFNGLVNGKAWLENLFEIMPLEENEVKDIRKNLKLGIQNVIYANLLSGAINTVVVVLIMLIFGLPNISIAAIATFIIGVLPLTPSELAYALPIILLFPTNPVAALVLIPIAELIILYINYVLLPKVIAGGDDGNPLLILTSILSGIAIFGLMGFIIAPVLMILIQTLYNILVSRIRLEKMHTGSKSMNKSEA